MSWLTNILRWGRKPVPHGRLAFDVSNFYLNYPVSTADCMDYMRRAKAQGYEVMMVEANPGEHGTITEMQIQCGQASGLYVDAYPWTYFDNTVLENLQPALDAPPHSITWLDLEDIIPEDWTVNDTVKYVAQLVSTAWTAGLKPGIYTSRRWWTTHMGTTTMFAYLVLWDADPDGVCQNDRTNWDPYGGWTKRLWKQYAFDQKLVGMNVDLSVEWLDV